MSSKDKDVRTIGSQEVQAVSEQEQLEKEEKEREAVQKAARRIIIASLKTQLKQIKVKLDEGMTIEEVVQEVEEKRSNLPANARKVLLDFKPGAINEMVKEI